MPTPSSFWDLPIATIEHALDLRKRIEALQSSLASILGGNESGHGKVGAKRRGRPPKVASVASVPAVKVDGRKGKRSAAARAKMADAAKARWAAKKGGEAAPDAPVVKTRKKRRTNVTGGS